MKDMDVLTIGEALVEFVKKLRDSPHNQIGDYIGPFPSGAPAIFADAAARLGLRSAIIGAVGGDAFGRLLIERLNRDGVNIEYLRIISNYTTGIAFVMYYSDGRRSFVFHLKQSAAAQVSPDDVNEEFVKSFKVLHVMGSALSISEGLRKACYKAVGIASRAGMIITYDPNLRSELMEPALIRKISEPILKAAEIVMPSKGELFDLTGESSIESASGHVLKYGVRVLIVKLGDRGSIAITRDEYVAEPSFDVQEVDPTGAGDAFDAALIFSYLRRRPIREALTFANAVGAMKVMKVGPMEVPESLDEVISFIRSRRKNIHE